MVRKQRVVSYQVLLGDLQHGLIGLLNIHHLITCVAIYIKVIAVAQQPIPILELELSERGIVLGKGLIGAQSGQVVNVKRCFTREHKSIAIFASTPRINCPSGTSRPPIVL